MTYTASRKNIDKCSDEQQKGSIGRFVDSRSSTTQLANLQTLMANSAQQSANAATTQLMAASPAQRRLQDAGQLMASEPVAQCVLYKGPRTDKFYTNAPVVKGMAKGDVRNIIKSDEEWYYNKKDQTIHKKSEPKSKKEKSEFVKRHERKSKAAFSKVYKLESKKRKRVSGVFDRSAEILKKAKTQIGNKVYDLNGQIETIYSQVDTVSDDEKHFKFQLDDVHFSIQIPQQSNIKKVEDVLSLTHVSLKGTGGKSSYAGMVENNVYPTSSSGNPSFQYLYALEALRNPQFLPSLILKDEHIGKTFTFEEGIDPELFGVHELKGAAGKERDKLEDQRYSATSMLLDKVSDTDDVKEKMLNDDSTGYEKECEERCAIQ
ncbi:MAG: hypothetical protein Q7T48_12495 [Cellvibrio sp.]|uniref:hypothetical protein n=1 Tax=Cellvibrio sp. TaxID=1965322 RepID=UPI002724AA75|nr:hypothetical protein [Cellvibrio sp.]